MKQLQLDLGLEEATANISGDRFLLVQAIGNLLDNAIEFSPAGGRIVLAVGREPGAWLVRVEDSGPGIPEFAAERVFDRFYSLPRPDGSRSSGIGLSFVREVASLHGGSIELENRQSGGAIARLRLPAR